MRLTDTQLDVLRLIAEGRALGDYVPRYRPGARRGRGAFPTTIAARAAAQLAKLGLVAPSAPGYVLTQAGADALAGVMRESSGPTNQDWSQEEILDYIDETAPYLGGLSDAHTRLNLSPEMFQWEFRELPVSKLLHLKSDWRRWYENEREARRDEDGDDSYFDGLEQEWSDGQVGPIIAVIVDGELDIGDGWHRAAIAVTKGWKTVPAVVGTTGAREMRGLNEPADATCRSLWLKPSPGVKTIELACFEHYPYFFESFEQYGIKLPSVIEVRWKPIEPYLHAFSDEVDAAEEFIEEVAGMIVRGESVPPILIDAQGELADGRHRAWAAQSIGIKKVPVTVIPYETATGRFKGVGRVAGRKLAYVAWSDGRLEEITLSEFRRRFGVSALTLSTGSVVTTS
jgi:hypothetical protein